MKKKAAAPVQEKKPEYFRDIDRPYEIYSSDDPARPITWRHDRLRYLLQKPPDQQVFLNADDAAIRHGYLFCQTWAAAKTPEERYRVRQQYPGIAEALQIFKYQAVESTGLLEGYILADTDTASIAEKFSILPYAVAWYEQLFFDVRSRLQSTLFIETSAIKGIYDSRRAAYKQAKVEHDLAKSYKAFGYHGGIVALELISTGFLSSDAKPLHRETAVTFIQNASSMLAANQGSLILHGKKVRDKPSMVVAKMAIQLALRAQREGKLEVIQNVSRALEAVAPLIGDDVKAEIAKMLEKNPAAGQLLQSAAELRATEQLKFDRGLLTEEQTNNLLQLTYQSNET
jgi:hypothetical protein